MANQSAAAVTAFRKKLQAATRQAARNPDQLKKTLYGLKNEWVKIVGAYPEVDRVGNAQYLRILLTPGAMQFSGDNVQQYLGDLVGTLGWVEKELKLQGKSAKAAAVIQAAKAVGTPRVKASRASAQLLAIAQDVAKIASDWERFAKEENRKPNWTAYGRFRARWGGWFSDVQTSDRAAEQRITNRVLIDDLIDGIREELPNPAAHIRKLERELKKAAAMVK